VVSRLILDESQLCLPGDISGDAKGLISPGASDHKSMFLWTESSWDCLSLTLLPSISSTNRPMGTRGTALTDAQ
jgi:hypothetical protein